MDHGTDSQNLPLLATSTQSSGHSRSVPASLKRPLKRTVALQPKSTKRRKDAGKLMCDIVNKGGTYYGNQISQGLVRKMIIGYSQTHFVCTYYTVIVDHESVGSREGDTGRSTEVHSSNLVQG